MGSHSLFQRVVALWKMTEALHMLGDYEREFEYAELGLERFPDVGNFYLAKARALAAMGLAAEATEVIDACLPVKLREGGVQPGVGVRDDGDRL